MAFDYLLYDREGFYRGSVLGDTTVTMDLLTFITLVSLNL